MKKLLILVISVALAHVAFAQKCKWTTNKKDAFTGEQTNIIVHTNSGVTWTFIKRNDKLSIEFTFLHAGEMHIPMAVTDTVLVKLADGSVLHLMPSVEVPPFGQNTSMSSTTSPGQNRTAITRTLNVTAYSPLFLVDRSIYEKLSNSGMVAVRMHFTGKTTDIDFSAKPLLSSVKPIMNNAKCILSLP